MTPSDTAIWQADIEERRVYEALLSLVRAEMSDEQEKAVGWFEAEDLEG